MMDYVASLSSFAFVSLLTSIAVFNLTKATQRWDSIPHYLINF